MGLHVGVHRVADTPSRVDVVDRAQVELALAGRVFGDVGQPQLVRGVGGEPAVDQVVRGRAVPNACACPSLVG